ATHGGVAPRRQLGVGRGEQRRQLARQSNRLVRAHPVAHALYGRGKAGLSQWLDQIVDGVGLERAHGKLVEGSDENDVRHSIVAMTPPPGGDSSESDASAP